MVRGREQGRSDSASTSWPTQGLEWLHHCPVCGAVERELLYEGLRDEVFRCAPGQWTLYRCQRCASGYLDPRPSAETIALAYSTYFTHHAYGRPPLDRLGLAHRVRRRLANGYRNYRYGTRERPASWLGVPVLYLLPWHRAVLDVELRHLPRPSGGRLLDVGCGNGNFLLWAVAAGWKGIGVDPDPTAVEAARRQGLDVYVGTVETIREEGTFDVVTMSHVLEHVHDPRTTLTKAYTLLKNGGTLWLDTPNIDSVGHRLFGAHWRGLEPPRHLVLFNPRSLRWLLSQAGFEVSKTVPRFEICKLVFAASYRLACGQNHCGYATLPLRTRLMALGAAWSAIRNPDRSEFITIVARKPLR